MAKSSEDYARDAREDVRDGKYDPPHEGAFGLRSTVVGSKYSEKEKEDRRSYKRAYKREKKRQGKSPLDEYVTQPTNEQTTGDDDLYDIMCERVAELSSEVNELNSRIERTLIRLEES